MCGAASGQTRLCPTMPRFSAFAWHTHQPLSTAANGKQPRQVATQREGMRHRRGGLDVQHDMPPPSGHEQDLAGPLDDHARSIGPVCPRRGSHVRVADLPATLPGPLPARPGFEPRVAYNAAVRPNHSSAERSKPPPSTLSSRPSSSA